MSSQIDDLVAMRDVETLNELLDDDDWMNQLDAAEGLVKLGDVRGLEFLLDAQHSEDREIRDVAKEILTDPVIVRKRDDLEAEHRRVHQERVEGARKRLQQGRKVFQYRMVYLASGDFMDEDPTGAGFNVPALTDWGLDGWEVVSMIPRRKQALGGVLDDNYSGAYFLLKKEIGAGEGADLKDI